MKKSYLLGAYFYIGLSIFPALAIAASSNFSSMGTANRSLVFFDDGQDNLDILSKKHPHLAEVAFKDETTQINLPQNVIFTSITRGTMLSCLNDEQYARWYAEGMSLDQVLCQEMLLFCSIITQIPYEDLAKETSEIGTLVGIQKKLKELVTKNPSFQALRPLKQLVSLRRLDPSRTLFEELVLASLTIQETRLKHGKAPVLFMGRSPSLLRVIYEELDKFYYKPTVESEWESHCLSLSFSGTPDAKMLRIDEAFRNEEKNAVRNMVTRKRLDFYMNYMDTQGMRSVGERLYLVENFTTGGGLVTMLRVLRYYYQSSLGTTHYA